MKPEELSYQLLGIIKREFYKGNDKGFFQERNLLLQAATYPARWLDDRAVRLPEDRYREILLNVIHTIKSHGATAEIRRFSAYFLHSVQEHMKHQGEKYYEQGKSMNRVIEDVFHGLEARRKMPAMDATVPALADVHRFLKTGGGRKPKPKAPPKEPDLFG